MIVRVSLWGGLSRHCCVPSPMRGQGQCVPSTAQDRLGSLLRAILAVTVMTVMLIADVSFVPNPGWACSYLYLPQTPEGTSVMILESREGCCLNQCLRLRLTGRSVVVLSHNASQPGHLSLALECEPLGPLWQQLGTWGLWQGLSVVFEMGSGELFSVQLLHRGVSQAGALLPALCFLFPAGLRQKEGGGRQS